MRNLIKSGQITKNKQLLVFKIFNFNKNQDNNILSHMEKSSFHKQKEMVYFSN